MNSIKKIFSLLTLFIFTQPIYSNNLISNNQHVINWKSNLKINSILNNKIKYNIKNNNILNFSLSSKNIKINSLKTFAKINANINSSILDNKNKNNLINHFNINTSYIGIKHPKLGTITYGKNYNLIYKTLSYVNIFPHNKSKFISNINYEILDNILTYKKKFKFKNFFIKNLKLISQLQIYNNRGNSLYGNLNSNDKIFSIGYKYKTNNGIKVSASYIFIKHKKNINNIKNKFLSLNKFNKNAHALSSSIKYNIKNLYISTSYAKGINYTPILTTSKSSVFDKTIKKYNFAKESENISLILKYKFKKINHIFGFIQTNVENIDKIKINNNIYTPNNIDLEKYFNYAFVYKFNKILYGYIEYKINLIQENNILKVTNLDNHNVFNLGLIYKFK